MRVKFTANKKMVAVACATALMGGAQTAHATNWLKLQGTEPANAAARAKVWGFIQPEYDATSGTSLAAGPWKGQAAAFNEIGPDQKTNRTFNIRRARLSVRGQSFPLDGGIDYFFMVEAGNNIITRGSGSSVKVSDASVTLNYIKGVRVRVGLFKTPTSEEGLQGIGTLNYINFTNFAFFDGLERHFHSDGSVPSVGSNDFYNGGAFRDTGVQVFDWFDVGNWEHTYAVMVGNGNGTSMEDNDSNKDLYLYWSSERVYGGKGPRRQGLKLFGWYQNGKRTLNTGASQTKGQFNRTRYGVGMTYLKGKVRAAAEYIKADGMIFNGTDGGAVAGTLNNAGTVVSSYNILPKDKSDGWYVDFGYKVLPKVELDARYDVMNRATDTAANDRKFDTLTLGAQYFFNLKTRFLVNYEIRNAKAPGLPSASPANKILDGMDNRLSLQLLAIF